MDLAGRLGCTVSVLDRGGPDVRWLELAVDASPSDDEQVIHSLARSVERLEVGFRLREHLTEVRLPRRAPTRSGITST